MNRNVSDSERLGILLVDHGSKLDVANESLARLAGSMSASGKYSSVRHAHMELASPTIAEAFGNLVADGVTRVMVMPYFLALGRHASQDIPRLCTAAAGLYPEIAWQITDPVGSSPDMLNIIDERIGTALDAD
jgi:sirohydrochlorin ferrochelatase